MSRLLEIKLPASFIVGWSFPTGPELAYGFRNGWIRRSDVVEIALTKCKTGLRLRLEEEELGLLLSNDLDRVDDLVSSLEWSDQPMERRARFWMTVILAWLLEHRSEYEDPFGIVDIVYSDFEYPEEIAPLVGYTPLSPGDLPGTDGILDRWSDAVARWRAEFRERDFECRGRD